MELCPKLNFWNQRGAPIPKSFRKIQFQKVYLLVDLLVELDKPVIIISVKIDLNAQRVVRFWGNLII
jgi:hypothetical protein